MPLRFWPPVCFATAVLTLALLILCPVPGPAPGVLARACEIPAPVGTAAEDVIYRIPKDEQVPGQIVVLADAGDVADWGHAAIGVPEAWKATKGEGVVVAVLDTGIDHDHRDLKGQIVGDRDFSSSRRSGSSDVNGHGTHCAGVIAAAENGVGMVGVAPKAKLVVGKVLGDRGWGTSSGIAAGIDWAVAWRGEKGERVSVISMSLGSPSPDSQIHAAVKRAAAAGVIVVCAAGNEGPRENTVGYPGGHPEVICVAATDSRNAVAGFSSRGKRVDVAAPGVNVKSCYPGDRFATMSGTSMATPYVAGVAALYVSDCQARGVKYTPEDFRKALTAAAKDLPPAGRDTGSGFGLVQPGKMFAAPKQPDPKFPDPPAPDVDRLTMDFGEGVPFLGRKLKRVIYEFEPLPKP